MVNLISQTLTASVARYNTMIAPLYSVKAITILKRNIETLLAARKETQTALAKHIPHSRAWINKFLNDRTDKTQIQIKDVDRIASFFGIEPYQLFMPGINRLTERRLGITRRSDHDRRIGHEGREFAMLRTELNKLPHPRTTTHGETSHRSAASSDVPEPIQRILAHATKQIAAVYVQLAIETRQTGSEGPQPSSAW